MEITLMTIFGEWTLKKICHATPICSVEYLAKHQLTSDTTDFYGARHVAGDLLEFIYSLSRNVTSRLLPGCGKVKDWVKFAEITPFKFFTDYFGEIDRNGDGKLQFSEIEGVYRTVLQVRVHI